MESPILAALDSMPAVALIGPRQAGKTTLALEIAAKISKPASYLDLELPSDLTKLDDAESYLRHRTDNLLIIDEIQRRPNLFPILRSIIDSRIRSGERTSQFLILGSASPQLLRQSSESLAGRIRYLELHPLTISEIQHDLQIRDLWMRGGFPLSFLASDEDQSWSWRRDFISSYVERDIPQLGVAVPSAALRNFWSMLAYGNANQVNYSSLGLSMGVNHSTVRRYLDILKSAFVVRSLPPWTGNIRKRLIKSPKIYLRDSGLTHCLLGIKNYEDLAGNPAIGASWEAFVVENIVRVLSDQWSCSYYRSRGGAEIDLVLQNAKGTVRAIEIKHSLSPRVTRGFYEGCTDVQATERYVIYTGTERFSLRDGIDAIGVTEFLEMIQNDD